MKVLTKLTGILVLCFNIVQAQEKSNEPNPTYLLDLFQNQRFQEAADYLKATYSEPISDRKILSRFGYSLQMAGRLSEAEHYYQRILDLDSADVSVLFSMANIQSRKGNYSKATQYYKRIVGIDSTNFSVYKQLGTMTEAHEGLLFATPYLVKANRLNPTDGEVAYDLARVLRATKQVVLADSILNVAIAADSTNLMLLRGKAELSHSIKRWPEVIRICNRILYEGDSTAQVVKMLGESYFHTKNYSKAIAILQGLERKKMQNEAILYFIAMSYKGLNNQPKSIEYFYKTLVESISPNVADYYAQIGDSYEKSKIARKALQAYQKSLQFEEKPMTYYAIANIYDQSLKNGSAAVRYFKKYLASKPSVRDQKAYINYSNARVAALSR